MTRTEERLTDALRASASRVRDDQLRPLADVAVPGWGTGTAWRRWLAPLAAAASVALVIGVIVAVGHQSQPRSGRPSAWRRPGRRTSWSPTA